DRVHGITHTEKRRARSQFGNRGLEPRTRPEVHRDPREAQAIPQSGLHRCDKTMLTALRAAARRMSLRQSGGEERNRALVDFGLVPFLEHGKVLRALGPRASSLPAVALEVVCSRGEHVGHAVDEVAPAIAIEIYCELHVLGRQELGLPDLAGPGA